MACDTNLCDVTTSTYGISRPQAGHQLHWLAVLIRQPHLIERLGHRSQHPILQALQVAGGGRELMLARDHDRELAFDAGR